MKCISTYAFSSSWPRDWTQVSCIAGRFFKVWATPRKQSGSKAWRNTGKRWGYMSRLSADSEGNCRCCWNKCCCNSKTILEPVMAVNHCCLCRSCRRLLEPTAISAAGWPRWWKGHEKLKGRIMASLSLSASQTLLWTSQWPLSPQSRQEKVGSCKDTAPDSRDPGVQVQEVITYLRLQLLLPCWSLVFTFSVNQWLWSIYSTEDFR